MKEPFLAIINPRAGGGRCGKMAGPVLKRLRQAGVALDQAETGFAGHGQELVRSAYRQGYRRFIAVGGDGTSFEIVNGLFPEALAAEGDPPLLGFLPLGTGNSFLRDFSDRGLDHAFEAIAAGKRRACDVLCLQHQQGNTYYINLLSIGFPADVAAITNRRFKRFGELGYLLGILTCLIRLKREAFPLSVDGESAVDRRRCLLLTFSNSRFTGGKMMLAPRALTDDGRVEYVRWGPVGRLSFLRNLPGLYTGSHIENPMAECLSARRIDFQLDRPVDTMVDGEVLSARCRAITVLPSALQVMA